MKRAKHIEREGNNSEPEAKPDLKVRKKDRGPMQGGKTNPKHLERVSIFIRNTLYTDQETIYVCYEERALFNQFYVYYINRVKVQQAKQRKPAKK